MVAPRSDCVPGTVCKYLTAVAIGVLVTATSACQTGTPSAAPPPANEREQAPASADPQRKPTASPPPSGRGHTASGVTVTMPAASPAPPPPSAAAAAALPIARVTTPDVSDAPIYDRSGPAYDLLQRADTALADFPLDREGNVDWVRALRSGRIAPRISIAGGGQMPTDPREIVMRNTREMPAVVFPHQAHTEWLACDNCHEGIFIAKQGANTITMDDIFRGRYCGVCHDKVAFSTYVCDRCHSVPAAADKAN